MTPALEVLNSESTQTPASARISSSQRLKPLVATVALALRHEPLVGGVEQLVDVDAGARHHRVRDLAGLGQAEDRLIAAASYW